MTVKPTAAQTRPITEYRKLTTRIVELAVEGLTAEDIHHKQWYLDQIVRELTGDEYENSDEWDAGVAP